MVYALQIVLTYTPVVHTGCFRSLGKARVAKALIEEAIAKGKFRNDPDIVKIEHDAGEMAFRASDIAAVTITNTTKFAAFRAEAGDTEGST